MTEREERIYTVDGVPYAALAEPDLRWLKRYGTVVRVWDREYSGNLCFGVEGPYGRLFIKYAGAETVNGRARPVDAIFTLHNALTLYSGFHHPALVDFRGDGHVENGCFALFDWYDGVPLRFHGDFSALERVRRLPLQHSLPLLDQVFDLHAALAMEGYVAVDFSDANVLVDFHRLRAAVCDIDLYRRKPARNDRGRMPGTARFMAPEEYEEGALLDETTTEYNMAALAFAFYAPDGDRSRKAWNAPPFLWEVAHRATAEDKGDRYPSMRSFLDAWREAVGQCRFGWNDEAVTVLPKHKKGE